MCGIAGMMMAGGQPVDRSLLQTMTTALVHRGPDGDGYHVDGPIGLGHRRLAVIDIAGGAQPFASADERYQCVYNGEIYNYREIRTLLERAGHVFRTASDTEVLVQAYAHWGQACLERLNGMFAFAIWDSSENTLFCARDRFGQKPFHYLVSPDGSLYFASEIKGLYAVPGFSRKLDPQALDQFFAYGYVPEPRSIYGQVHKLAAGCFLTVAPGTPPNVHRYYDLPVQSSKAHSHIAWDDVSGAVMRHMVSDVPVGCFLSSGMDSASIAAAMVEHAGGSEVASFTLGADDPLLDERPQARRLAETLGTTHRDACVTPQMSGFIDRLIDIYGEPFADPAGFLTDQLAALARPHITVALGGDGADELFGGYRRYRLHIQEETVRRALPAAVRAALFAPLARLYPKLDWAPQMFRAKSTLESLAASTATAYFNSVSRVPDRDRLPIYSQAMLSSISGTHASDVLHTRLATCPSDDALDQLRWMDVATYLSGDILVKTDRATMAHGLEGRLPFLDPELAVLACALPTGQLVNRISGKALLRAGVEARLPKGTGHGPKRGFSVPLGRWIKDDMQARAGSAPLFPALYDSGLVRPDSIEGRAKRHAHGRRDAEGLLWSCMLIDRMISRGVLAV